MKVMWCLSHQRSGLWQSRLVACDLPGCGAGSALDAHFPGRMRPGPARNHVERYASAADPG